MSVRRTNERKEVALEPIEFAKLSGSGNDFILISNMDGRYDDLLAHPEQVGHFARTLCRRGLSVGADGVIFASEPEVPELSDISARLFEADGSEAELCGNGTACFVRWVTKSGICEDKEIRILTPAGVVLGTNLAEDYARVCIPLPTDMRPDLSVEVSGHTWKFDLAVTGVPHAVIYVTDVENIDMAKWGPGIRHHPFFAPRGVNVNFVQVLGPGHLAVRTWEFGVEGETLACGTGSAAAAIMAVKRFGWDDALRRGAKPILVRAHSGDTLRIYLTLEADGSVSDLCLETLVRWVYTARLRDGQAGKAMQGPMAAGRP